MPRYMVERTFPEGLNIPVDAGGAQALGGIVATNASEGVTWVHSYVSADKTRTFCVYDAPSPEAIRSVGAKNGVPVDAIHEVSVLDPYFYHYGRAMIRPATPDHRLNTTGCIILPASLFIALMIAGPGTAIYPPVSTWTAPLICSGNVEVDSNYYSVRPGESGVSRTIHCVSGEGKGARSEITWSAIGIAFLVYAAIAFLALRFLVAPWLRRRAERALLSAGIRSPSDPGAPASAADLRAILAQVSQAVGRGAANVVVRQSGVDLSSEGGDPAERLAQLKQLRDQGLISAADYEAKKAEILSRL